MKGGLSVIVLFPLAKRLIIYNQCALKNVKIDAFIERVLIIIKEEFETRRKKRVRHD